MQNYEHSKHLLNVIKTSILDIWLKITMNIQFKNKFESTIDVTLSMEKMAYCREVSGNNLCDKGPPSNCNVTMRYSFGN